MSRLVRSTPSLDGLLANPRRVARSVGRRAQPAERLTASLEAACDASSSEPPGRASARSSSICAGGATSPPEEAEGEQRASSGEGVDRPWADEAALTKISVKAFHDKCENG
jgi:hypothetical protein